MLLIQREFSDRTSEQETIISETEELVKRQNDITRVVEDIRREPHTRRIEEEATAPESIRFVHRTAQSSVDEETIEEIRETLRRQEKANTIATESVERIQTIENRLIKEENRQVVSTESEEAIAEMVGRSLRSRLDEITGKVYGRIEKQLNNERRRRGL